MSTSTGPPRRKRRWVVIPVCLLLGLAAGLVWVYVRGTRVDTQPRDPDAPGGVLAQVHRDAEGRPCVRAAILLQHPADEVWKVVTDYENYGEILPYLREIDVTRGRSGARMTGKAASAVAGWWDFAIDIVETETDGTRRAAWDHSGGTGQVQINRGSWTVIPRGKNTLLVLTLEAEVRNNPSFVLRNYFLHRLPRVLAAVEQRLADSSKAE
jgi:ribosome-associated toxin RatA of RatAB toxin-antitoxin module